MSPYTKFSDIPPGDLRTADLNVSYCEELAKTAALIELMWPDDDIIITMRNVDRESKIPKYQITFTSLNHEHREQKSDITYTPEEAADSLHKLVKLRAQVRIDKMRLLF